tara:strand:- start:708 stop:1193 length:486 start_codon:yes stop_codon:yes gene_type:complete
MIDENQLTWQAFRFADLDKSLMYSILELRQKVFVVEQNCAYRDLDGLDQVASHITCIQNNKIIAYARGLPPLKDSIYSTLGRILVAVEKRGAGLGRELVQRSIDFNLLEWPNRMIRISAQSYLIDFYQGFGFEVKGSEYLEDGIPHTQMIQKNQLSAENLA